MIPVSRRPENDTWSSASRQHYIDTGYYLPASPDEPKAHSQPEGPPMEPLDTRLIAKALGAAERSQRKATQALNFTQHYAQQVQERYGEGSTEFQEADTFHRIADEFAQSTRTHLEDLRRATPAIPPGH